MFFFMVMVFLAELTFADDVQYIKDRKEVIKYYYEFQKSCYKEHEKFCNTRKINTLKEKCVEENFEGFSKKM